ALRSVRRAWRGFPFWRSSQLSPFSPYSPGGWWLLPIWLYCSTVTGHSQLIIYTVICGIAGRSRHQAAMQDGHAILEYRQPRSISNVACFATRADLCPFALTNQGRQGLVCAVGPQAAVSGVRTPRIPCLTLALAKDFQRTLKVGISRLAWAADKIQRVAVRDLLVRRSGRVQAESVDGLAQH